MTGYNSTPRRSYSVLSIAVGLVGSLAGFIIFPLAVRADDAEFIEPEPLEWARIDFLRNRVQLLPDEDKARRARISDILGVGDALRTLRRSRAELRFNDDSLARIGERATFRFTPNTRNFQLTNGTALLLIPPGRGRSSIQTPNAVTGIQGSALFVRYIPETDTTIVGALTDNPNGPMVLFNKDGSEQQALRANEIGVIEGDQITQLYRFDSQLFWESSGLAEGFDYMGESSTTTGADALDGVRQEIREAITKQAPLPSSGEGIIENPESFSRPNSSAPEPTDQGTVTPTSPTPATGTTTGSGSSSSTTPTQTTPRAVKPATSTTGSSSSSTNNGSGSEGSVTVTEPVVGSGLSGAAERPISRPVGGATQATGNSTAVTTGSVTTGSVTTGTEVNTGLTQSSNQVEVDIAPIETDFEELETVDEPVIDIPFEGTPAETYLAIPLPAQPSAPTTPLSILVDSAEAESGDTDLEDSGEVSDTNESTDVEPELSEAEVVEQQAIEIETSGPITVPDTPNAFTDKNRKPPEGVENIQEPNIQAPSNNEDQIGLPGADDQLEPPIITEDFEDVGDETSAEIPIILEDIPNPDLAEPVTVNEPLIDPSTSLVPIEIDPVIEEVVLPAEGLDVDVDTDFTPEEESEADLPLEPTVLEVAEPSIDNPIDDSEGVINQPEDPEEEDNPPEDPDVGVGEPDPEIPDPELPDPELPDPELPDPELPDPELPDPETPDPELPDPVTPDPELPDPELPDPELPDPVTPNPELPGPVTPDPEIPDPELLDPELPDPVAPDPEIPDPVTPDPELPDPELPDPELPDPVTPDPELPDPELPDPELPDPVTPDPELPDPVTPDPELPDPELPDPELPDPVTPDPELPDPVIPDPEIPDPEILDPVTPDPVTPDPELPDPVTPDPELPDPVTPDPELPDTELPDPELPDPEIPGPGPEVPGPEGEDPVLLLLPENIIPEDAQTPEVAIPVEPSVTDGVDTEIPFEPEVGGNDLEDVLDPVDLTDEVTNLEDLEGPDVEGAGIPDANNGGEERILL